MWFQSAAILAKNKEKTVNLKWWHFANATPDMLEVTVKIFCHLKL